MGGFENLKIVSIPFLAKVIYPRTVTIIMSFFEKLKKGFTVSGIIIFVVGSVVGSVIGFCVDSRLTEIHKVSDVEFMLGPMDKDGMGYYFPLKIINSGGRDLEDIRIRFQNDYMEHYTEYHILKLIPTQLEVIKLRDKSTILMHTKKTCGPNEEFSTQGLKIQILTINGTNPYVPPQNGSVYLCDFIRYNAIVCSKDFKKKFEGRFYAPKEIRLKVTPDEVLDISNSNQSFITELDSVEIYFFDKQELSIYNRTSFPHNLKYGPCLPKLPFKMHISFKEYSDSVNITVDYFDFPKFSRYL